MGSSVNSADSAVAAAANLHPVFDRVLPRAEKEARFRQHGRVIWLYGLSGSGKSTLAIALERSLFAAGFVTHLLDGDNVRTGLNRGLGFSDADRAENLRRVAEVAKLFVQAGIITICSFITPLRENRSRVREIIGSDDLLDVYVKASFETCARRDPKGLYAKAAAGGVGQFTGRDSTFEPPEPASIAPGADVPALVIDTEAAPPEACLQTLLDTLLPRIRFPGTSAPALFSPSPSAVSSSTSRH
ncbi:adenylylsulfate kinase [Opitutaceae bacterium TAV5]|nr:adenylylsulfate kinase [Opitutaceae bacterium TAV5]